MNSTRAGHFAALMLLVATAGWALSFSLGKDAGARMNVLAGAEVNAFFGPVALQGVRFVAAALIWFAVVPSSRRGWTRLGIWRAAYAGLLLGGGTMLQHLALDRTSPAATAFLTTLTVLWVPAILCVYRKRLPGWSLVGGVGVACVGLWLMLGEGLTTFRWGELLGVGCSIVFAFYILAVSDVVEKEGPWRMIGGQFAVCGLFCLLPGLVVGGVSPGAVAGYVADAEVWWRLTLLLIFPTFVAYGLMNIYQPRVDATRAALIYLVEPVLAAAFDWATTGRGLSRIEMLGAALILGGNAVAELFPSRPAPKPNLETQSAPTTADTSHQA